MIIGFVGAGKMAEAMMVGLIERRYVESASVVASDVNAARLSDLGRRLGIRGGASNIEVVREADVCFLAVKPQQLDAVLAEIAAVVTPDRLVISIAAGKRIAGMEALLPRGRVVRVMPNIACLAGAGMNVFTRGARATEADAAQVRVMLECCGRALELPEDQFDAVTALSGSGPAFFAYLLDGLVDGAVREGLSRESALMLAAQTMEGTARLLLEQGLSPADLAAAVTSAKGTTAAGREVLENDGVADVLVRTIQAAARRSRELSHAQ
jgi:pyrroline-5-carboxylate reductase